MTLDKIIKNFNKQLTQLDKYVEDQKDQRFVGETMIAYGNERVKQADSNIGRASRIRGKIQEIIQ